MSYLTESLIPLLKDQMSILEEQKYILLSAVNDAISTADEIMILLKKNDIEEAIPKVEYLKKNTLDAKNAVVSLDKGTIE
jgi:hypothetical protein